MDESILDSIKKLLGIDAAYVVFDPDLLIYINSAFSTLNQLGVIADPGFHIEDNTKTWAEVLIPANQLHMLKNFVTLSVRRDFDPPTTSYLIDSLQRQIDQLGWRLNIFREVLLPVEEVIP